VVPRICSRKVATDTSKAAEEERPEPRGTLDAMAASKTRYLPEGTSRGRRGGREGGKEGYITQFPQEHVVSIRPPSLPPSLTLEVLSHDALHVIGPLRLAGDKALGREGGREGGREREK
jgi:hypothetical protein